MFIYFYKYLFQEFWKISCIFFFHFCGSIFISYGINCHLSLLDSISFLASLQVKYTTIIPYHECLWVIVCLHFKMEDKSGEEIEQKLCFNLQFCGRCRRVAIYTFYPSSSSYFIYVSCNFYFLYFFC
jgi:hypothetical protein